MSLEDGFNKWYIEAYGPRPSDQTMVELRGKVEVLESQLAMANLEYELHKHWDDCKRAAWLGYKAFVDSLDH